MSHEVKGECIIFKGWKDRHGYGHLVVKKVHFGAHALALRLHLGRTLGPGMYALHKCHNPPCINPDHLYEGTQKENVQDAKDRGLNTGAGLCPFTTAARKHPPEVYDRIIELKRTTSLSAQKIADLIGLPRTTVAMYVTRFNKGEYS